MPSKSWRADRCSQLGDGLQVVPPSSPSLSADLLGVLRTHTPKLSEVGTREQTEFRFPERQARGVLRNQTVRFPEQFLASDFYPGTEPAPQGSFRNLSQLLSMD